MELRHFCIKQSGNGIVEWCVCPTVIYSGDHCWNYLLYAQNLFKSLQNIWTYCALVICYHVSYLGPYALFFTVHSEMIRSIGNVAMIELWQLTMDSTWLHKYEMIKQNLLKFIVQIIAFQCSTTVKFEKRNVYIYISTHLMLTHVLYICQLNATNAFKCAYCRLAQ